MRCRSSGVGVPVSEFTGLSAGGGGGASLVRTRRPAPASGDRSRGARETRRRPDSAHRRTRPALSLAEVPSAHFRRTCSVRRRSAPTRLRACAGAPDSPDRASASSCCWSISRTKNSRNPSRLAIKFRLPRAARRRWAPAQCAPSNRLALTGASFPDARRSSIVSTFSPGFAPRERYAVHAALSDPGSLPRAAALLASMSGAVTSTTVAPAARISPATVSISAAISRSPVKPTNRWRSNPIRSPLQRRRVETGGKRSADVATPASCVDLVLGVGPRDLIEGQRHLAHRFRHRTDRVVVRY